MTTQNGRAFNEWLRAQLKAKKMSQRQLAQQSGVDHSTISRLIRGDRMPSLGTATKLARGLRELRDDADTPQYLGLVASGATNPTARVEYALRADELLSEPQVRQIMEYYLAVRMRRYGRAFQPARPAPVSSDRGTERPIGAPNVGGRPMSVGGGQRRRPGLGPVPGSGGLGHRRQHGPLDHARQRPRERPLLEHFQGTTRTALHRPGLGDSERRRLGRRRSRFQSRRLRAVTASARDRRPRRTGPGRPRTDPAAGPTPRRRHPA